MPRSLEPVERAAFFGECSARSTACERAITNLDNAQRDVTLKYVSDA